MIEQILSENGYDDWQTDGFGIDSCLICPCGNMIEQDGKCQCGNISPLRQLGLI